MSVVVFDNEQDDSIDAREVVAYVESNVSSLGSLTCHQVLNDSHVPIIAGVFCANFSQVMLHTLKLPNNALRGPSFEAVGRMVESLMTLRNVDMSHNPMEREDLHGFSTLMQAMQLHQCRVTNLNLNANKMGPKGGVAVASVIRNSLSLVEFSVAHNGLGTKTMKDIAASLRQNDTLLRLDLSHNKINDRGIGFLSSALSQKGDSKSVLEELDLTYNKIGVNGAEKLVTALLSNSSLRKLNMGLNQIGMDGASYFGVLLQFSKTLSELILSSNNIGAGVEDIASKLAKNENSKLKRLDLSWNSVTDEGARHLAEFLRSEATLEYLNLDSNAIGDEGMAAIADSLRQNMGLRELSIVGNQMTSAEPFIQLICRESVALRRIHYERNNMGVDAEARLNDAFAFRRNMESWLGKLLRRIGKKRYSPIDLRNEEHSDFEVIRISEQLEKFRPVVKTAIFGSCRVSDRGVRDFARKVLRQDIQITKLQIKSARLSDAGIASLSKGISLNTTLKFVRLENCGISSEGAKYLASAICSKGSSIERLILPNNQIGDDGAACLLKALLNPPHPTINTLNLSDNEISDDGLKNLDSMGPLEELYLDGNAISDRGALDIAKACIGAENPKWLYMQRNMMSRKGIQSLLLFLPCTCAHDLDGGGHQRQS